MSAAIGSPAAYTVRLEIDYPDRPLNRVTSAASCPPRHRRHRRRARSQPVDAAREVVPRDPALRDPDGAVHRRGRRINCRRESRATGYAFKSVSRCEPISIDALCHHDGCCVSFEPSVERSDKFADRWPCVGCGGEREVLQRAVAADDGVGTELVDVLGRSAESMARSKESCVHPDGAR